MKKDDKKYKKPALEVPDITPYKKAAAAAAPAKSKHKHEWKPIILRYVNDHKNLSIERGFTPDIDYAKGSRCEVCGRLKLGFPKSFNDLTPYNFIRINPVKDYPDIPWTFVVDLWHLNKD